MRRRAVGWFCAALMIAAAEAGGEPGSAAADSVPQEADESRMSVEASTSFWWIAREEVENGLRQPSSLDPADQIASGFSFRQGRIALQFATEDRTIEGRLCLRLEERTDILDFWGLYRPAAWASIAVGQMKIPSTAEVMTADDRLDFISRTTFGRSIGDFSLARTPYISPVMAAKSYDRDLGVAVRVEPEGPRPRASVFMMAGNGLGGNRYIGATESKEFLFSNGLGELYYGARLSGRPLGHLEGSVRDLVIGVHGSVNRHEDVALDARGPVVDLDRTAWSADAALVLGFGASAGAFAGAGRIDDDWGGVRYRFDYSGWGTWALWRAGALEVGARRDEFESGYRASDETTERHWTFGANFRPRESLRLQINYVIKETESVGVPDPDDDILYLNVQFKFGADLSGARRSG